MSQRFGGFFERLGAAPPLKRRMTKAERIAEKAESVKRQLQLILNARKGASLCAPEFGLADFNDAAISTRDMISIVKNDIRTTINCYEPRITVTDVVYEPWREQAPELKFIVNGFITVDNENEKIELAMTVDRFSHRWRC